jgi:hypothetical protein
MSYRAISCAAAALFSFGTGQAAVIKQSTGAVQQMFVASDTEAQVTMVACGTAYADLAGSSIRVTVPAGANQLVVARFNGAASTAQSGAGVSAAYLRILVGGRNVNPAGDVLVATSDSSFIRPPATVEGSAVITPGAHIVKVQFCAAGDSTAHATLRAWHFTIDVAPLQ